MEGINSIPLASPKTPIWTRFFRLFDHLDTTFFPARCLLGPMLLFIATAVVALRAETIAFFQVGLAFAALYPIWRWRFKAAVATLPVLFATFLFTAHGDPLFSFYLFASCVLSLASFTLAIEDYQDESAARIKELSTLKEELSLWKRRFETLSEKAATEKDDLQESLEREKKALLEEKEYTSSLKKLVEIAEAESRQYLKLSEEHSREQMDLFDMRGHIDELCLEKIEDLALFAAKKTSTYLKSKSQVAKN